jgi:hypothetical protein
LAFSVLCGIIYSVKIKTTKETLMEIILIAGLVASIVWSWLCTSIVFRNEDTINYLLGVIKELEKENSELNDHIRELLFPDEEPDDEIDWFNKNNKD